MRRYHAAIAAACPTPSWPCAATARRWWLGGAALTLDKLPRLAALGLIASTIPTTLAGHPFWNFDGAERKAQEIQFLKNAALVGGLLLVLTRSR